MEATGGGWLPAIVMLAIGLVVGAIVIARVAGAGRASATLLEPELPAELRDLLVRRQSLFEQLRELEDAASKRTPEQLASDRFALELEAARVLQSIDRARPRKRKKGAPRPATEAAPAAAGAPPPVAAAPSRSPVSGFLWGVGVTIVLGSVLFFASRSTEERTAGGPATGASPSGAAPSDEARLAELRRAAAARPDDVDAHLDLARALLAGNDYMGGFQETQAALKLSPGHPRALTYQAFVRVAMGQTEVAESMLRSALAKDPQLLDAHVNLMYVYVETGREAEADAVLKEASGRFPDQAARLAELLGRMKADSAARGGSEARGAGEDPHAGVVAPGLAAEAPKPAAGAPASSASAQFSGTLELDPASGPVAAGAVIYVTVREAGVTTGPPIAVKRLPARLPVEFAIGEGDSMSGEPLPASAFIEARVDTDGNAASREPDAPVGRADAVKRGSHGLKIVLKPRS
ncbi:MAG TPA: tetratricopeptide repeat protein [Vicinamibacteria bacterium]|nr:tetratricopeptide repeat protein [Vicinamibacteria bacterium]